MRISFSTIPGNLMVNIGYGYAGYNMVRSLQRLGHDVPFQDATAPVQIHFSQPEWYDFADNQYKIGYTPWESTGMPDGWVDEMNMLDELWTPSDLVAEWYQEAGVKVPLKVYEHGVDKVWSPKRRRRGPGPLKFLHMGEPAPRKGGQMAFDAFMDAFGANNLDVHLTIKSHGISTIRHYDNQGSIIGYPRDFKNVTLLEKSLPEEELVQLFHDHDVLLYPGWGEGFGLIPLQALATGMPTICTGSWAPYRRFLLPGLTLDSELVASPWDQMHPGLMYRPDYESLVASMVYAEAAFDGLAGKAYRNAFKVQDEYDWDRLTEQAFADVVTKFG